MSPSIIVRWYGSTARATVRIIAARMSAMFPVLLLLLPLLLLQSRMCPTRQTRASVPNSGRAQRLRSIPATSRGTNVTLMTTTADKQIVRSKPPPLPRPIIQLRRHNRPLPLVKPNRRRRYVQPRRRQLPRLRRLPALNVRTSSIVHHPHPRRPCARNVRNSMSNDPRRRSALRHHGLQKDMKRRHARNPDRSSTKSARNVPIAATTSSTQAIPCCNMGLAGRRTWLNVAEYGAECAIIAASET